MRAIRVAWFILAGVLLPTIALAASSGAVALCDGCRTPVQFRNVGAVASWTLFQRQPSVLVINPDTTVSMHITLAHPDAGPKPLPDPAEVDGHSCVVAHDSGNVYRIDCGSAKAEVAASSPAIARGVSPQLGEPVTVRPGVALFPLPASPWFASYRGVNREALDAELRYAAGRPMARGELHEICPIFNNGDSACFRAPGAAATVRGHGAGPGATDTGVAIDNRGDVIDYGAPGSTGAAGERWLSCDLRDGRIDGCREVTR